MSSALMMERTPAGMGNLGVAGLGTTPMAPTGMTPTNNWRLPVLYAGSRLHVLLHAGQHADLLRHGRHEQGR